MKTLLILFLAVCLTASEVHRPDDDCVRKSHNSATSTWTSEDGSGDGLSDHLHEEVTTYDDEDHDESVSAGRSTRKICKSNGDNAHSRSSHKTAVMESDPLEDNEETHDVDHADDSESSESDARIDNDEFTVADTDEKHDFDHSHAYDSTQDDLDIIGAASEKVADWGTEVDGRERSERRDEDKCHAPTKEIVGVPISRKSVEARRGPSAKRDGGEGTKYKTIHFSLILFILVCINEILKLNIKKSNTSPFEFSSCYALPVSGRRLAIGVFYRPPGMDFAAFTGCMEEMLPDISLDSDYICCLGDFNVDFLRDTPMVRDYRNVLVELGRCQLIGEPTRVSEGSSTLIDHVLVSENCSVVDVGVDRLGNLSDHCPVCLTLDVACSRHSRVQCTLRNFSGLDKNRFRDVAVAEHRINADLQKLFVSSSDH